MTKRINYRSFIEDNFLIKNKSGEIVRFILNETQSYYYNLLVKDYPTLTGIRENILKFRQPGMSSLIDGIFAVDFILSEEGRIPLTDTDIVSHKESEAKILFSRFNFFLESYFARHGVARKSFLAEDTGLMLRGQRGAIAEVKTASARVSGRGGTKQNIHWSEVAFYSNTEILNAEDLVTGAEQQVADGVGKIFRETTGNLAGDFFSREYQDGNEGRSQFKSRFFGWWIHPDYSLEAPQGWIVPDYYRVVRDKYGATVDQCYWHFQKTRNLENAKKLREYPTYDTEAFLLSGEGYFSKEATLFYEGHVVRDTMVKPQFSGVGWKQFRPIEKGEKLVIGGDCAQGGADFNVLQVMSKSRLDIPLVYRMGGVASEMTANIQPELERLADITGYKPVIALERNNGGASEMSRLETLNRNKKYELFVMPKIGATDPDDNTNKLGWDTNSQTRSSMLGDWNEVYERKVFAIYDLATIAEHRTFILNDRNGKPEAATGMNDDCVMSLAIANQLFNRCEPKPLYSEEYDSTTVMRKVRLDPYD